MKVIVESGDYRELNTTELKQGGFTIQYFILIITPIIFEFV